MGSVERGGVRGVGGGGGGVVVTGKGYLAHDILMVCFCRKVQTNA